MTVKLTRKSVLKGVTIGCGAIVASGSIVNRSVPEFSIVAGVPARIIKPRFSTAQLIEHKRLLDLEK